VPADGTHVLPNAVTGTFKPQVTYTFGAYPDGVAVGDRTGDTTPDLAVVNPVPNGVSVRPSKCQ
jgi:hypothetical protein